MNVTPPDFSRKIPVMQDSAGGGCIMIIGAVIMGGAGIFIPAVWLAGDFSWSAMAFCFACFLGGTILGLALGSWVENCLRRLRGLAPPFYASTQVDIDAAGVSVEGIGVVAWRDVLAIEAIPDSDSALLVHTRQHEKLMLSAPTEELIPLISHYMDQFLKGDSEGVQNKSEGIIRCRVVVFHWPRFMVWVWAGYLLSGALSIAMIAASPYADFLKNLILIVVLMPVFPWLVWAVPFARLGLFASSRVRVFELDGAHLRSTDGTWDFDLNEVTVIDRHSKGIGFDLQVLSFRPSTGRGVDILIDDEDGWAILHAMARRKLIDKVVL